MLARTVVKDFDVEALAESIRLTGPDARVVYDVETGCSAETDEAFGGKGALFPYAGAYLTGMSLCIVHPYVWQQENPLLTGVYVPLGHKRGNISQRARQSLASALGSTHATHVGFNTPFDWAFLLNEGILFDTPVKAHDVQIKRWLQDENGVKKLKVLGEMWLGEDAASEQKALHELMRAQYKLSEARQAVLTAYPELGFTKGKRGTKLWPNEEAEAMARQLTRKRTWGDLTCDEIGAYASRDATLTAEIDHLLDGESPQETIEREMKVNAICIDMTRRGVSVDINRLRRAGAVYAHRAGVLQEQLKHEHGLENPNSGPQVAALLYDRLGLPIRGTTPTGAPATDKNALEQLAGDPVARMVLEYRKWDHARTAYAEPFARFAERSPDGRVHGMYGTTRTVTGRLAASGPNVMTIPRDDSLPEIRKAFLLDPAKGVERLGFDLASAELWVTASYTGDPVLTQCLLDGRNLHIETMLSIFGGEPDKSRREYTLSKNGNYGIEYGAGIDQLTIYAAKSGCGPEEARRVAERFHTGHKNTFAKQHQMADWWSDKARQLGRLPLEPEGRYRHFRSPGKQVPYYTALNALVQGGVAEFMKDTMIELYKRGYGELLILQVHDELVFDVPAGKGMQAELLDVLQKISHDINPFRFELTWDAKKWSV